MRGFLCSRHLAEKETMLADMHEGQILTFTQLRSFSCLLVKGSLDVEDYPAAMSFVFEWTIS